MRGQGLCCRVRGQRVASRVYLGETEGFGLVEQVHGGVGSWIGGRTAGVDAD